VPTHIFYTLITNYSQNYTFILPKNMIELQNTLQEYDCSTIICFEVKESFLYTINRSRD